MSKASSPISKPPKKNTASDLAEAAKALLYVFDNPHSHQPLHQAEALAALRVALDAYEEDK